MAKKYSLQFGRARERTRPAAQSKETFRSLCIHNREKAIERIKYVHGVTLGEATADDLMAEMGRIVGWAEDAEAEVSSEEAKRRDLMRMLKSPLVPSGVFPTNWSED